MYRWPQSVGVRASAEWRTLCLRQVGLDLTGNDAAMAGGQLLWSQRRTWARGFHACTLAARILRAYQASKLSLGFSDPLQ